MPSGLTKIRYSLLYALIAVMLITTSVTSASDGSIESSTITVDVTGYGASVSEARADAVRQAMQRALSQLVVSDVEVNQDKVLRDRVMSTMNGFVDKVKEHSVRREGDEIVILSSITVSTKRISNFIGLQSSAAEVDGLSLFSELNRETEQREVVAEMLARSFRGFPSETIETIVTSIKPAPDNPNEFIIEFNAGFRKEWIQGFEDILKALAVASYEFNPQDINIGSRSPNNKPYFTNNFYMTVSVPSQGGKRTSKFISNSEENGVNIQPLCIVRDSDRKVNCYVLPAGNYQKWLGFLKHNPYAPNLDFITAATNENGQSTMIGNCCRVGGGFPVHLWIIDTKKPSPLPSKNQRHLFPSLTIAVNYLYADKITVKYRASRSAFNLSQTKKLLILPVVKSPNGNEYLLDAVSPVPVTEERVIKAAREAALQK